MIKILLIVSLLLLAIACQKQPVVTELSDDYVLIEFAARLEEDYQKIYPEPLEDSKTTLPE
jgi:hypothetical protein